MIFPSILKARIPLLGSFSEFKAAKNVIIRWPPNLRYKTTITKLEVKDGIPVIVTNTVIARKRRTITQGDDLQARLKQFEDNVMSGKTIQQTYKSFQRLSHIPGVVQNIKPEVYHVMSRQLRGFNKDMRMYLNLIQAMESACVKLNLKEATSYISTLVKFGRPDEAVSRWDELTPELDDVDTQWYNVGILASLAVGDFSRVRDLHLKMDELGIVKDGYSWLPIIETACRNRNIEQAIAAYDRMLEQIQPVDSKVYLACAHAFLRAGRAKNALLIWKSMEHSVERPKDEALVAMYDAFDRFQIDSKSSSNLGNLIESSKSKNDDFSASDYTLQMLNLAKLGRTDLIEVLFEAMKTNDMVPGPDNYHHLLLSHLVSRRNVSARRLFDQLVDGKDENGNSLPRPNDESYNIMIRHYCDLLEIEDAQKLLEHVITSNMKVNVQTAVDIINVLQKTKNYDKLWYWADALQSRGVNFNLSMYKSIWGSLGELDDEAQAQMVAEQYFVKLIRSGVQPDIELLLSIIGVFQVTSVPMLYLAISILYSRFQIQPPFMIIKLLCEYCNIPESMRPSFEEVERLHKKIDDEAEEDVIANDIMDFGREEEQVMKHFLLGLKKIHEPDIRAKLSEIKKSVGSIKILDL